MTTFIQNLEFLGTIRRKRGSAQVWNFHSRISWWIECVYAKGNERKWVEWYFSQSRNTWKHLVHRLVWSSLGFKCYSAFLRPAVEWVHRVHVLSLPRLGAISHTRQRHQVTWRCAMTSINIRTRTNDFLYKFNTISMEKYTSAPEKYRTVPWGLFSKNLFKYDENMDKKIEGDEIFVEHWGPARDIESQLFLFIEFFIPVESISGSFGVLYILQCRLARHGKYRWCNPRCSIRKYSEINWTPLACTVPPPRG